MANWGKILSRGNVEDRRGLAPVVGGIGVTGVLLFMLVNYLAGGDPTDILSQLQNIPLEQQGVVDTAQFEGEDEYEVFASTVLGSNNDMWSNMFSSTNLSYSPPRLVLFRTATQSECGSATSEVGPHYCPYDQTIYLDETFFDEMQNRFGAQGGDVAQAYVISHEAGHHAQNLLGTMNLVRTKEATNPVHANDLSIKLELQADCYAGLWANSIKDIGVLSPGEIQEAMDAAAAVGDDRIQQKVGGYINPETWTHGSSEQRVAWFNRGYETGSLSACDTLNF